MAVEKRPRGLGEQIGARAARTLLGAANGGGIASTVQRLAAGANRGNTLPSIAGRPVFIDDATSGPSGATSHEFTFSLPTAGVWVAQVNSQMTSNATYGQFEVTIDGGDAVIAPPVFPVGPSGDASDFSPYMVNVASGTLTVTHAYSFGDGTSFTFSVEIVAYRIS